MGFHPCGMEISMKRCNIHTSSKHSDKRKLKNSSQQLGYNLAGPIMQKYRKAMKVLAK